MIVVPVPVTVELSVSEEVPTASVPPVNVSVPFTVVVGATLNVPEVMVSADVISDVVLPPTLNAVPDFATVIALNVWLAAEPLMDWVAEVLIN